MAASNKSFELTAANQGEALAWTVESLSATIGVGIFDVGDGAWTPYAAFERAWYSPQIVHQAPDVTNGISSVPVTDLETLTVLLNNLIVKYNAHIKDEASHLIQDYLNWFPTQAIPEDLEAVTANLSALKDAFNEHLIYYPGPHDKWDSAKTVTGTAVDLATALSLGNNLLDQYNAHIVSVQTAKSNTDSIFIFLAGNIEQAEFAPDSNLYESFEKKWHATYLDFSFADKHLEYLGAWELIGSELGVDEHFEMTWLLPGSSPAETNDKFLARYYDSETEDWVLTAPRTDFGALDNFESGWRSNEVAAAEYYYGGEWRFLAAHLCSAGFGQRELAEIDLATNDVDILSASSLPDYSPYIYLEVIAALNPASSVGILVVYKDAQGTLTNCTMWIDSDAMDVGDKSYSVAAGTATHPSEPRTEASVYFNTLGISEVTNVHHIYGNAIGKIRIKGWLKTSEEFTSDWTQALE